MAALKLRDRDAIVTREGIIFRVLGYSHPHDAYVCDAEYAPATIFRSDNPKAYRKGEQNVFYKFYEDGGWKFLEKTFPAYLILHEMLDKEVVGVTHHNVFDARKPYTQLKKLINTTPRDQLHVAIQKVVHSVATRSDLPSEDFGVFGSLLHGFHNPKFSDIDLIVYGKKNADRIRDTLQELYEDNSSSFHNEFETYQSIEGKTWRFQNLSPQEYVWHQRRKLIYALFNHRESRRMIKTEFEPVKDWKEINNEYDKRSKILQRGWTKMLARVINDADAPFVPSVYGIEPLEVIEGEREAGEAKRIISYMEEFRLQASKDEIVYLEGNLEEVVTSNGSFWQIALTYCPRYYEQVLKSTACDKTR